MRLFLLLIFTLSLKGFAQSGFIEKTTSKSKVKLSFTNAGTFGNAFRGYRDGSGRPSCAYPDSLAIEHIFEGGFWIGGKLGGVPRVSTSAIDGPQGYRTGAAGYEWTEMNGGLIRELSNQDTSQYFDSSAIAAQQFEYSITDSNLIVPGTTVQIQGHSPMSIDINMKLYNFLIEENHSIVFVEAEVINNAIRSSVNRIDSVYFGVYMNAVVRNILATPVGSGGAAFYNKGGNGYIDKEYSAFTYDYSGDVGRTNTYIAQKILGLEDKNGFYHPEVDSSIAINYNVWNFNSIGNGTFNYPKNDIEKYKKLANGIQDDACWITDNGLCGGVGTYPQQLNSAGNRSDLLSIGPINNFDDGDTITFTFAIVFAQKLNDAFPYTDNTASQMKELTDRLSFAQMLYNGEDVNFNGILDAGEDKDGNGKITRYYLQTTGLEENKKLPQLLFQNPSNGHLMIDFSNQTFKVNKIEIYSMTGKLVYQTKVITQQLLQLDISHYRSGTYFIKATNNQNQIRIEKLLKL